MSIKNLLDVSYYERKLGIAKLAITPSEYSSLMELIEYASELEIIANLCGLEEIEASREYMKDLENQVDNYECHYCRDFEDYIYDLEDKNSKLLKCYVALDKVRKDPVLAKRALLDSGIYYIGKDGNLKLSEKYGGTGNE